MLFDNKEIKNKLKENLKKLDKIFGKFIKTETGKFLIDKILFRKTSFYSLISLFGSYLIMLLTAYSKSEQWTIKINEVLNNSEGWEYIGWLILSFILPSEDLLPIIIIISILIILSIIRYRELNQNINAESLFAKLEEKTKNILFEIKTSILFNDTKIVIDRTKIIKKIKKELESRQIFILSGIGGVGKTAIIKSIYEKKEENTPFYVFKARTFQTNNLFANYTLEDFINIHKDYSQKIVVIDSAEALLDFESEYFKEVISALISNKWKIIFTTRYTYLDDLNYYFVHILDIIPFKIDILNLTSDELESLSKRYGFNLPQDDKLQTLIENPFYLDTYLSYYTNVETHYQEFKESLWNQTIKKSLPEREECFLKLVTKRVNEGQFYLNIKCSSNTLEYLRKDGILGYEKAGYFIAHDLYEEWALNEIIERAYIQQIDEKDFFLKIGNSLSMRRAFRNWVSEKLLLNNQDIKTFLESIIDNSKIESFWKDEVLVSILLSDYSNTFFVNFKNELLKNDFELLSRIAFLLRLACKDIDDSFWENLGIKSKNTINTKYVFTQPKGKGWESFIAFIYNNIDTIKLNKMRVFLPVLKDWSSKFKQGTTTYYASLTALKYYKLINTQEYRYSYKDSIDEICQILSHGSSEITDELLSIFNNIIEKRPDKNDNKYYELSKMALTSFNGLELSKNLPESVIKLASLLWTKKELKKEQHSIFHHNREDIHDAFNISSKYEHRYYPASAIQTPIYFLLKHTFSKTVDFVIDFINKSVEYYVNSDWQYKENIKTINIILDNGDIIQQYHSQALWNLYRGTSSPVMPDLLQCIHMALEKYLLEIANTPDVDNELLELILLNILIKSKSSSLTAIVSSVVLANPNKTFKISTILFKTKEFIQADLIRQFKDSSETKFLYGMGYGLNWQTEIFQNERLNTCKDKHRKLHLENLFFHYQTFRTDEITEETSKEIQTQLWSILDKYYHNLPPENKQSDEDKQWRIALARMDRRYMNVETQNIDKDVQITFNPKLSPELKTYSENAQQESSNATKYTSLYLWSSQKIQNNEAYKKYETYENDPLAALEKIKEVLATPHEKRDYIFQDEILPNTSVILLQDYSHLLQDQDKELCKDILLEFAYLPFKRGYYNQTSDGVETTVTHLPIVLKFFPELINDIKILLLFHLFDNSSIGNSGQSFNDFAIKAINKYFTNEVQSFIYTYLILKPLYEDEIILNYRQKTITQQELIENFIQSNEETLNNFCSNTNINFNLIDLDTYELETLIVTFKMIEKVSYSIDKKFILKIVETCSLKILYGGKEDIDSFELKNQFIDTFTKFILEIDKNDISFYLEKTIKEFQPSEEIVSFFTQLIYTQDKINNYENFWEIWEMFESKIVEICQKGDGYNYIDEIITVYLFSIGRYGTLWNENTKEWHSFQEKDKRFMKRISEKIGHCPSTLYALSSFLTTVGSKYLYDGIGWIAQIVRNHSDTLNKKVDSNTIFNLENILRKYIFINLQTIRKERKKKEDVLIILNLLIEQGSSLSYMLREKIL